MFCYSVCFISFSVTLIILVDKDKNVTLGVVVFFSVYAREQKGPFSLLLGGC